jgi:hypothetical protein
MARRMESKRRGATRPDWRLAHHQGQGKGWFYTTKAKFPEFLERNSNHSVLSVILANKLLAEAQRRCGRRRRCWRQ